jgi:hypothetical protein
VKRISSLVKRLKALDQISEHSGLMIEFFQQAVPLIRGKKVEVVRHLDLCFEFGTRAKRNLQ